MSRLGQKTPQEANAASTEAFKGAVVGAAKVCTPSSSSGLFRTYYATPPSEQNLVNC